MKKLLFLATGLITLASCSENDFVGDEAVVKSQQEEGMITFSTSSQNITRADKVGAEAAEALNKNFVVGGFKGAKSVATTTVFDNYNVEYTQNTANKTESNTHNWEYVGLKPNDLATIPHGANDKQTIKYWDYNQAQYDFIAYSLGNGGATATPITPSTATESTGGAYTLTGTTNQLKTVHIADLKTVLKADYNKVVELKFRSLGAKIRIGLYETIPGYSVKDVKFYPSDAAINGGATSTTAVLYAASSVLPTEGKYTVYFPTVNNAEPTTDKNKAHVDFTTSTATQASQEFGALAVDRQVKREKYEYDTDETKDLLGRTSNTCTFAGTTADNYYVDVLPLEAGPSLTLKIDYTLISTDGSHETIKVVGAKAVVPATYVQWKPGYAYTYIFKISDNTNGWTSGVETTELAGLYPITFDAVVVDSEEHTQSTITTVAMPSITTYQKGHDITKDEYNANKGDIYVQVIADGTLKDDLGTNGQLYSLSAAKTEAEVMDALNIQTASDESSITGRNGLVLTKVTSDATITTIPGADGNNITVNAGTAAKFTPVAPTDPATVKYYAYVYYTGTDNDNTEYHTAVALTAEPTGWPTGYFTDEACTTQAPNAYADGTYYQKYTNLNKVYGVKVIKVASGS